MTLDQIVSMTLGETSSHRIDIGSRDRCVCVYTLYQVNVGLGRLRRLVNLTNRS